MPVRIDLSQVHRLARDLSEYAAVVPAKAEEIVAVTGHRVVSYAQTIVEVDTGNLKNSISVDVDGLSFVAGPTAEYGEYVEEGSEPHAIPNAFGYGPDFGTEDDFHPGNAPAPFMGPAWDAHEPIMLAAVARLGESILD